MSHVSDNVFDVNLHQSLDSMVDVELRGMEINEETSAIRRNRKIMELMLKHCSGLDRTKVISLFFHEDSEETSHFFAFLEEAWKSKSFHKIGSLGEHLILDQ